MYLEGVEDGRRFYDLARATTPRKPIIVLRGGISALGRQAASSHTGALAGSAEVFRAAARQAGVIMTATPTRRSTSPRCSPICRCRPARRVAVVTLGGGWGVLTADALAEHGLKLASLPAGVLAEIGGLLPPFWSRGNPIDLVATVSDGVPERIIELVAGCDEVDAVITLALIGSPSSGRPGSDQPEGGGDRRRAGAGGRAQRPGARASPAHRPRHGTHWQAHRERAALPGGRSVFPGPGAYAPVLLPTPPSAVAALARATWYSTHPVRQGSSSAQT